MIASLTPIDVVIKHFARVDPVIAKVLPEINWSEWLEDRASPDHFYNLSRNIIYQQLAGKAASTIFGRFENLVKEVTPPNVIAIEDQRLRDAGLSWAKVKYIKDLADKVIKEEVNLTKLDSMANEDVITELTKVKGIGRWTAEMFLLFTLHREDIFSYGDLGLKNGFAKLYGVDNPTVEDIKKVVGAWHPFESYASIALWHTLDNR